MRRTALSASAVAILVAAAWIVLLPPRAVEQPIAFSHEAHAELACAAVCHSGAETGIRAGIPQIAVCRNCHVTAPGSLDPVRWNQYLEGGGVPWIRVTHNPSHVYFSHARHVGLGDLDCVSCHGDIGTRASPPGYAPLRLTMETCLDCHTAKDADSDCASCHR